MRALIAFALLLAPAMVQARAGREMVEIKAGDPVTIRPDRAYILFRSVRPEGAMALEPVFLRIPSADEMARYDEARRQAFVRAEPGLVRRRESMLRAKAAAEARGQSYRDEIPPPPSADTFNFDYDEIHNLQNIDTDLALVRGRNEAIYLVEVIPGDYVLYGTTFDSARPPLHVCMCLGTIGFAARAGEVTDLGQFFSDFVHRDSVVPELRAESGFGPTMAPIFPLGGATIRPVQPGASVPLVLQGAVVRPAEYRAVGKFFDPRAMMINRLVPVPGILAYDGGRVIDVRTGQAVPDIQ
jgi:hypothetical protein